MMLIIPPVVKVLQIRVGGGYYVPLDFQTFLRSCRLLRPQGVEWENDMDRKILSRLVPANGQRKIQAITSKLKMKDLSLLN